MPYLTLIILALTGVHLPPLPAPPASAIVCSVTASFTAPGGLPETDASNALSVPYTAYNVIEGRPLSPAR